jgi:hypothetical protein
MTFVVLGLCVVCFILGYGLKEADRRLKNLEDRTKLLYDHVLPNLN